MSHERVSCAHSEGFLTCQVYYHPSRQAVLTTGKKGMSNKNIHTYIHTYTPKKRRAFPEVAKSKDREEGPDQLRSVVRGGHAGGEGPLPGCVDGYLPYSARKQTVSSTGPGGEGTDVQGGC